MTQQKLLTGTVIKSTGSWIQVFAQGKTYSCKLKGKLRLKNDKATNPIAVGDWVMFWWDEATAVGNIEQILDRKNYIIRKATNLSKQVHVLAANVDQAILVASLVYPKISQGFIDRFLVTAEAYHIKPILVFNKIDLLNEALTSILDEIIAEYETIGYTCIKVSATHLIGLDAFKNQLSGKISLISGFSGVGKTSLVNAIAPHLNLRTDNISDFSQKGKHTTTFAEMHFLDEETRIIDTPGIKELGIIDIAGYEVSHCFPEMKKLLSNCKFNTCLHEKEPDCAIINALVNGKISESRYKSYLSILHNQENHK